MDDDVESTFEHSRMELWSGEQFPTSTTDFDIAIPVAAEIEQSERLAGMHFAGGGKGCLIISKFPKALYAGVKRRWLGLLLREAMPRPNRGEIFGGV